MAKIIITVAFLFLITKGFSQKACNYPTDSIKSNYEKDAAFLLSKIGQDSFTTSYRRKDIPTIIKKELECISPDFSLANPGKRYDATDVRTRGNPTRQLIFMAKSASLFIVTYNHGGLGWHQHILIAEFSGNKVIRLWTSQALGKINSVNQVIDYIRNATQKNVLDETYNHI